MTTVRRENPYSTHHMWDEQKHAAYADMPKDHAGRNYHLHEGCAPNLEERWRKWCAKWPRELWPLSVDDHIARKQRNAERRKP